jgi:squalene-hopene/tetraprenyl-beta-curcumene cyclase
MVRAAASSKTLSVLENIQPDNGGFLEAVPLTSFVAISLNAAGYTESTVWLKCIRFLEASVRTDGSWPIDTNLSTWITTLSVNALRDSLPATERDAIRKWLLDQQYKTVHPYTGAAPGGWAWTDLPGGVPDADDTAGALIALKNLGGVDEHVTGAVQAGVKWLLDLQNSDGGIPTFCRGWGKLPFDRSSPDITAHTLIAWSAWRPFLAASLGQRVDRAAARGLAFLNAVQRSNGAWIPLWFGNQFAPNEENPVYGTCRVLSALNLVDRGGPMTQRGIDWLLAAQNEDGGWGGDRRVASTVEETSLAVAALSGTATERVVPAVLHGMAWLTSAISAGRHTSASPIGLYFAKLWYFERLYPLIFAADALVTASASQRGRTVN